MSIRKRTWGNGKQAWVVDVPVRGTRVRKHFDTKRDAEAYELEIKRRAKDGTFAAAGSKVRVKELVPDFLELLRQRCDRGARMTAKHLNCQIGHIENYILGGRPIRGRGHVARVFSHGLGDYLFDEVSVELIENYFDRLQEAGISFKTVREIRNTLIQLFELARKRKYIGINPAKGLRLIPHAGTPRRKKIVPPPKRLIRLAIDTADQTLSLQIKFAALTGLRASEQWALRWKHIDFQRGYISVETRLDELTKTEGVTKTEAGDREVPLSGGFAVELKALKLASEAKDDDLVFPSVTGGYRTQASARRSLYRVVDKVLKEWPEGEKKPSCPRWHDLRHYAISCWIEAGLPPKAIQEFAGHSSLQMTMDLYGHLFPSADHHRAMEQIANEMTLLDADGTNLAQNHHEGE